MERRGIWVWKWKVILRMGVEGKTNVAYAVEGVWEERKWKSEGKGGEEEQKHHKRRRGGEGSARPRPKGSAAGSPLPLPLPPSHPRMCLPAVHRLTFLVFCVPF